MKPFIHLFKTPVNYYFYDVNRNENVRIGKESYEYLDNIINGSGNYNGDKLLIEELEDLRILGYLSENKIEKIEHPLSDILKLHLERQIEMLILQVTQRCNLRCTYCPYSSNDGSNRLHSNKNMSWELAKNGLDYYRDKSIDSQKAVINFYGGEPLLEFDLIKKCVDYSKKIFRDKDIKFYITTNGTLINKEIATYLEYNNFSITISLDGSKITNDSNRKFVNKEDSVFDTVISNIKMINEHFKGLFTKLSISMVMDQRLSFQRYLDVFDEFEFLENITIRMSTIDDTSLIHKIQASSKFIEEYSYYRFITYLYLLNEIKFKNRIDFLDNFLDKCKETLNGFSPTTTLGKLNAPSGTCLVGKQRLMIDIYGKLFPCERVSETIDNNCLGHIRNGIEITRARKLLNVSKINENRCKECYVFRNCILCPKAYEIAIKDNGSAFLDNCIQRRREFHHKLIGMEMLNEIRYG